MSINLENEHVADLAQRIRQIAVQLDSFTDQLNTSDVITYELLTNHLYDIAVEIGNRNER